MENHHEQKPHSYQIFNYTCRSNIWPSHLPTRGVFEITVLSFISGWPRLRGWLRSFVAKRWREMQVTVTKLIFQNKCWRLIQSCRSGCTMCPWARHLGEKKTHVVEESPETGVFLYVSELISLTGRGSDSRLGIDIMSHFTYNHFSCRPLNIKSYISHSDWTLFWSSLVKGWKKNQGNLWFCQNSN